MKATLRDDMILCVTEAGDTEIGVPPPDVGWERLRYDGNKLVDLATLESIWVVPKAYGYFELHAVEVNNSQLVRMKYRDRKHLVVQDGIIRVMTNEEVSEKITSVNRRIQSVNEFRELSKTDFWIDCFINSTPEEIITRIDAEVRTIDDIKEFLQSVSAALGILLQRRN